MVAATRLLLFGAAGCSSGVDIVQEVAASWAVDTTPLLEIRGSTAAGGAPLGDPIGATRLSNGTIVVADRSVPALVYFDSAGRIIRSVGRTGKGPGEFEDLIWMGQCARDTILALDGPLLRMTVLDATGTIVSTVPFPAVVDQHRVACSRTRQVATMRHQTGGDHVDVKTWIFSQARGSVLLGTMGGPFREILGDVPIKVPRPLGQSTFLALSTDRLYLGTNDSAAVGIFSHTGVRLGSAMLTARKQHPTARQYQLGIEAHLATIFASLAERREHGERFTRIPPPEFVPFHGAILVDATDTAWAVVSPLDAASTRLQALLAGSVPGRVISLPRGMQVFEFGKDYILGRQDAESGEARVVVFRLERP